LQRLFPSFPAGWPGVGLLLLRAAVGASLALQGVACFGAEPHGFWTWALGPPAIGIGVSLLIGFLTPVVGGVAALIEAGVAVSLLPPSIPNALGGAPATILVILMAAAVVLLGPGEFSLDARLFGRREIVIPQVSRPPDDGA
jgi:uncharacterized membrane protein YphA (DoxX/SURF4 family)